MSLPREIARLAIGTIGATLNLLSLLIWVPLGLILLFGIAGIVFAPIWQHLAAYWWVYLFAAAAWAAGVVYLLPQDKSHPVQPNYAAPSLGHQHDRARTATPTKSSGTMPRQTSTDRPTAGKALFRYTEEWLARNGMYEGKDISKTEAVSIAGHTAIAYHLRENNFVEKNGRILLTAKGKAHFLKRRSVL